MAESAKAETKSMMEILSPVNFVEAQKRRAALFAEANELTLKTARTLWESEMELFRLGAEQAAKGPALLKAGENPAASIAAYCEQQHERADQLIAHLRKSNDLILDYGWQLLAIYGRDFKQTVLEIPTRQQSTSRGAKV